MEAVQQSRDKHLMICRDCDLPQTSAELPECGVLKCSRCDSVIYKAWTSSHAASSALAWSALIFYLLILVLPVMTLEYNGQYSSVGLIEGVVALWENQRPFLSMLVLFTSILAPGIEIVALLYLIALRKLDVYSHQVKVFQLYRFIQEWGMLDVFLLAALVTFVKLGDMANVTAEAGLYLFAVLIFLVTAACSLLPPGPLWLKYANRPS